MGPLSSRASFEKVQSMIRKGIEEGAELIAGGLGRPDGITKDTSQAYGLRRCQQRHDDLPAKKFSVRSSA